MDFTFEVLKNTRNIFNKIIDNSTLDELNKIPEGFNNNIIWNIGHILVTEQLLTYKLSGLEVGLDSSLIAKFGKGTKPLDSFSKEEVDEIKALLFSTIKKTKEDYSNNVFENYNAYTVSTTGNTLTNIDEALQFIAIHEGLHYGYVLALLKMVKS